MAFRSMAPTKTSNIESSPIKGDHAASAFEGAVPADKLAIKYPRVQSMDDPDIWRVTCSCVESDARKALNTAYMYLKVGV